jgi:hypothetical protein
VQLELDRHVGVEAASALVGRVDPLEQVEEEPVRLAHALDLDGLRVLAEVARGDGPGREVAQVEGGGHATGRLP